jgi:hypothetical protein
MDVKVFVDNQLIYSSENDPNKSPLQITVDGKPVNMPTFVANNMSPMFENDYNKTVSGTIFQVPFNRLKPVTMRSSNKGFNIKQDKYYYVDNTSDTNHNRKNIRFVGRCKSQTSSSLNREDRRLGRKAKGWYFEVVCPISHYGTGRDQPEVAFNDLKDYSTIYEYNTEDININFRNKDSNHLLGLL